MSNTPHMLPCPFCGGDARHDAHADDCYFILHRKFNNSGADMSLAFEVLDAWNRRAPQPVVREPLSDEQIVAAANEAFGTTEDLDDETLVNKYGHGVYISRFIDFARAIEAEVHKQDTELIQQLVEALEGSIPIAMGKAEQRNTALIAARARRGEKT